MKFLSHLLGIIKLGKEKDQRLNEKKEAQNIVKEIKLYQEKWLQYLQRMDTNRLAKQAYSINQYDEGILEYQGRDGENNILRIKEKETRLNLQEHDDDDDDYDEKIYTFLQLLMKFPK